MRRQIRPFFILLLILPLVLSTSITSAQAPVTAAPRLVVFEGFFRPT